MPIYEYRCPACGDFDVMQKITEKPLKKCPHCKKAKVTKLMSSTAFQLKGTGWYVTDYASKGKDGGSSEKKDSSSSSEASSSSNATSSSEATSSGDKKSEKKATGAKGKSASSSTEAA
jgi:putative FmdB family regulatory protein